MHSAWTDFENNGRDQILPYMFMLVAIGLVIPLQVQLNTACVYLEHGVSLHCNIKNELRNRLKMPQVDAILRIKLLRGSYQDFDYQAAINLKMALVQIEVCNLSDVQLPFIADNEEEDVQDFADADSDATVSKCAFSDDKIVEHSAVQRELLYAYIAEANGDETLDQALGLDWKR